MDPAFMPNDINMTRLAGDGEEDAAVSEEMKMDYSRYGWSAAAIVGALAIIAFILVMILWFPVQRLRSQMKELHCTKLNQFVMCNSKEFRRIKASAGIDTLPNYSAVVTALALLTGAANGPLLFNVATPTPPTTVTQDAQTGTSSLVVTPFEGCVQALQIQLNAVPTAGSVTVGLTINGVLTALANTFSATSTAALVTATLSSPLKFEKNDQIGVVFGFAAGTIVPGGPLLITAQPVVKYAASTCA
jgi:hypothetical protein